ncbi:MAG TPA: methylmalonyl-CoA mutase family protein, partial [Candidatus Poseidoniales archaeon]|nr:methylmalonyl-CoA mutase family protein [Candidatus Poseidoniales archaeon]
YLAEIAATVRDHHNITIIDAEKLRTRQALYRASDHAKGEGEMELAANLERQALKIEKELNDGIIEMMEEHRSIADDYRTGTFTYTVRDRAIAVDTTTTSLAGSSIPRIGLPRFNEDGSLHTWLRSENLPGHFPFTAGVYPFKRSDEAPTRMFAGEGPPERTNQRFHYLSENQDYARLSTAFDSVTLYGRDPDLRPDIYGKVGNSGVSIATLDDAKRLYSGFDLCDANTSVSMTINGPAPIVLAFFLNAAIDQQVEKRLKEDGRWDEEAITAMRTSEPYSGELPQSHGGLGLGTVGIDVRELLDVDEYKVIEAYTLQQVRGTVQADILKEDQAQNTCIFSTDFALKLMGDVQQYYIDNGVRNHYSVSISGYHIAEAGANPITQLALTLANGFTYVEYYLSRGMEIDDFAPNLSFFFSNGLDPEYTVIGRVARRIWAIAMRDLYGADERSQKLKYHIQTSGRSLHAQEIDFNDIRTTLQALLAIQDHANSLHTNAYDEAVTTPTRESVRRALAIQLIINKESGWTSTENPLQGSFIVDELTGLVEQAVLEEFEALSRRGGVLGAMETMYQRAKIQDESIHYEQLKHSGEHAIIGVNTFLDSSSEMVDEEFEMELARATPEEKRMCLDRLTAQHHHFDELGRTKPALESLKEVARSGENIFGELMQTVRVASLGQITSALFEVGGCYRRNM